MLPVVPEPGKAVPMLLNSWLECLTSAIHAPTYTRTVRRRLRLCSTGASRVQSLESRIVLSAPDVDLSTLLPVNGGNGSTGFTLFGINANDLSGAAVSNAGDVNGDGFADLLIGAPGGDAAGDGVFNTGLNAGESYVVFGKSNWSDSPTLDLSMLNGTNGFKLFGVYTNDVVGNAVSGAGDVNGDGFDDLLIGGPGFDAAAHTKLDVGESYLVFGKPDWSASPTLDLSKLNGTNGFTLFGVDERGNSGRALSAAGDVNGDGIDDLMIGAPFGHPAKPDSGKC